MSSANSNQQPISIANSPSSPSTSKSSLSPEAVAKWELGVSLIFHDWRVLTDAVAGQWGGPDSDDKRDWLCGAIADMLTEREETDEYDLEDTLVHAMEDEFLVNPEDDSAWQVSQKVVALRKEILSGDFSTVDRLHTRFLSKPRNQQLAPPPVREVIEEAGSSEDDNDSEEAGSSKDDNDSDEEMSEAPPKVPVEPRQRLEHVVDEDGFELIQKRGSRKR